MNSGQLSANQFRARLRKLQDKKKISKRELLGLLFDVYEMFMLMNESMAEEMLDGPGFGTMFKVPSEVFDEVVKRDKKATADKKAKGKAKVEAGTGQYL